MGKNASNPAADATTAMSQELFKETSGVRKGALNQGQQILDSGGASVAIPIIQQAIQSSRFALSRTMQDMQGRMGRLAGTPFGQRMQNETQLSGEMNIANIAPSMNMDLFKTILGFAGNQTSTAVGGQSAAAGAEATRIASQNDAFARIMSAGLSGVTAGATAGGKAAVA